MSDIQTKLDNYLNDTDDDDFFPEEDIVMMEKMIDFLMELDTENLTEEQIEEVSDIIDQIADNNIDEVFSSKKVKIKPQDKRRRKREYRKKRSQFKLKAKKFRRTTKFKRWKRMKDRKKTQGKTARGKRIRKFL